MHRIFRTEWIHGIRCVPESPNYNLRVLGGYRAFAIMFPPATREGLIQ